MNNKEIKEMEEIIFKIKKIIKENEIKKEEYNLTEERRQSQIDDIENILYELAYLDKKEISSEDIKKIIKKTKGLI